MWGEDPRYQKAAIKDKGIKEIKEQIKLQVAIW